MAKFLKITAYFLIILFLLLFITAVTGFIVINKYGNEISSFVIHRLNKELAVRMEIREAEMSFFKTFPFASLVLEDIVTFSNKDLNTDDFPETCTDTLFRAEKIYVQFNIIDIIQGHYIIKRILATSGELSLFTDSNGFTNYKLFKKSVSGINNEQTLELELFRLRDFKLLMKNTYKDLYISGNVRDLMFKGKFGKSEFSFITGGDLYLDSFKREKILYAENAKINVKVNFTAKDSIYTIDKGILVYNDLRFETKGLIRSGNDLYSDIQVEGNNLNIKSLIRAIPAYLTVRCNEYSPEGKADIKLSVQGNFTGTEVPAINSEFIINRGSIQYPGLKTLPLTIGFTGSYSNGEIRNAKSSSFIFQNIHINANESCITGNLKLSDLHSPEIISDLNGIIHVNEINQFIDNTVFSFNTGILEPDLNIHLQLNSFKEFNYKTLLSECLSGNLEIKNISFRIKEEYPEISGLNGKIGVKNDSWTGAISFNAGKSNIVFDGQLDHILKRFVNKTSSLWVQGDVYADYLDLSFLVNTQRQNENDRPFSLPDKLFFKLHLVVDDFELNKFRASGIESDLTYKPRFLSITSLNMKTLNGSLNSFGGLIQDMNGDLMLRTSSQLSKINIKELFVIFNNFKQDFIISDNLEGQISGSVDFSANLNSKLEPGMESIYAVTAFTIENGELKDFAPLRSLSKFIELSELEHVKFKTLQNNIIIKEQKVFVPEMTVNSSAFNMAVSGEHGFDNNFEYKVKVNLSEILAKKARSRKENDEFAILEKDGQRITLFLTISGNPDDLKIRYDRKEAVIQIREDIKTEKQELKSILHEEFGLFKNQFSDSVKTDEPPPMFIFEWDEQENDGKVPDSTKRKKGNQKKDNGLKFIFD